MIRRLVRRFRVQRYGNPNLHEGDWLPPELRQGVVRWERASGGWLRDYVAAHPHQVFRCSIGPGMAHEDVCLCGAKRYGVFGSWS